MDLPSVAVAPVASARFAGQGGRRPLWHVLAALIAIAVVPLGLVTVVLLTVQVKAERATVERALVTNAQTLSLAVEREVRSYQIMLRTLAQSDALRNGDFPAFHALAVRVADERNAAFISLFAPDGRQILNSLRPYGAPLPAPFQQGQPATATEPPVGDASSLRRVFETGEPGNSNLFKGLTAGRLLFTVDIPIKQGDQVVYVLNVGLEPRVLADLVLFSSTPREALGVIVDANGFILARWDGRAETVGKRAGQEYLDAREGAPSFVTSGISREGSQVVFAGHTSAVTGWTSVSTAQAAALLAASDRLLWIGGLSTLASVLLGCGLAYVFARRLDRALRALVDVAAGRREVLADVRVEEIARLQEALLRARAADRAAAEERERLAAAQARQRELEQLAQSKDRFIATLSHELRNPLAAIKNATSVLRIARAEERVVAILDRQINHLVRLVDDLLDLSRLSEGKIRVILERLDLRHVLEEAIEVLQPRIERAQQRLDVQQPAQPVMVLGDRARLKQVVANLLDNASKYSPTGAVVQVRLLRAPTQVTLTVLDRGRGIDPAQIERVFEPFVQLGGDGCTEGLGLGLPLARQLAEQHGGTLVVHSDGVGSGCTATLTLPPVVEPASPAPPPLAASDAPA